MEKIKQTKSVEMWGNENKIDIFIGGSTELYTTLLQKTNKKMKYKIMLEGCDDSTEWEEELTSDEYDLLKSISKRSKKESTYQCKPRLEIEKSK